MESVDSVEEITRQLRRTHPRVLTELERMLDEFGRRFKPEPEEELLVPIHALVFKCYRISPSETVNASLVSTLDRVRKKFFTLTDKNNTKHVMFVSKYHRLFERDFRAPPDGKNFPQTVTELLIRLQKWRRHLLKSTSFDNQKLLLENFSPYLARLGTHEIEIPGQYKAHEEPNLDRHVILQRVEPLMQVHRNNGSSKRRITIRGDNGLLYSFYVQYQIAHIIHSDERLVQLYGILNNLFEYNTLARSRDAKFHAPVLVPLTHRLRLCETHEVCVHVCVCVCVCV
jgi:transformation/transcription domain-associated protein